MSEEKLEFDFSQFHDLAHPLWLCLWECLMGTAMWGGWQNHLSLWWDYKFLPQLHQETLCRIGRHSQPTPWWRGRPHPYHTESGEWSRAPSGYVCHWCHEPMEVRDDPQTDALASAARQGKRRRV